jgi:hypothetical protein
MTPGNDVERNDSRLSQGWPAVLKDLRQITQTTVEMAGTATDI